MARMRSAGRGRSSARSLYSTPTGAPGPRAAASRPGGGSPMTPAPCSSLGAGVMRTSPRGTPAPLRVGVVALRHADPTGAERLATATLHAGGVGLILLTEEVEAGPVVAA